MRRSTARAARRAGVIAHQLRWSMAHRRRVRVSLAAGGVKTGEVTRMVIDPQRAAIKNPPLSSSPLVATFDDGQEVAVDAIERVQLPIGDAGAAFGE